MRSHSVAPISLLTPEPNCDPRRPCVNVCGHVFCFWCVAGGGGGGAMCMKRVAGAAPACMRRTSAAHACMRRTSASNTARPALQQGYRRLAAAGVATRRCMHRAMNPFQPSQCPMCRSAYTHFPSVGARACMCACACVCMHAGVMMLQARAHPSTNAVKHAARPLAAPQPSHQALGPPSPIPRPHQVCERLHQMLSLAYPQEYARREVETKGVKRGWLCACMHASLAEWLTCWLSADALECAD